MPAACCRPFGRKKAEPSRSQDTGVFNLGGTLTCSSVVFWRLGVVDMQVSGINERGDMNPPAFFL